MPYHHKPLLDEAMRDIPFMNQDTQRPAGTDLESKKEYTLGLIKVVDRLRWVEVIRAVTARHYWFLQKQTMRMIFFPISPTVHLARTHYHAMYETKP